MKFLASAIFYPMLWLRGPFLYISKLAGGLMMLCFIGFLAVNLFSDGSPIEWIHIVVMGAVSFSIFLVAEFYDHILIKLNPSDSDLVLYK